MPTAPKRPCLVIKSETIHNSDTTNESSTPINHQKWVVFWSENICFCENSLWKLCNLNGFDWVFFLRKCEGKLMFFLFKRQRYVIFSRKYWIFLEIAINSHFIVFSKTLLNSFKFNVTSSKNQKKIKRCVQFWNGKYLWKIHLIRRTKKRVVFADDKGKSLTEIRVMSEPSNVPPLWSIEFLSHVTQGIVTPELAEEWSISFKQPASDYLNFR